MTHCVVARSYATTALYTWKCAVQGIYMEDGFDETAF